MVLGHCLGEQNWQVMAVQVMLQTEDQPSPYLPQFPGTDTARAAKSWEWACQINPVPVIWRTGEVGDS